MDDFKNLRRDAPLCSVQALRPTPCTLCSKLWVNSRCPRAGDPQGPPDQALPTRLHANVPVGGVCNPTGGVTGKPRPPVHPARPAHPARWGMTEPLSGMLHSHWPVRPTENRTPKTPTRHRTADSGEWEDDLLEEPLARSVW